MQNISDELRSDLSKHGAVLVCGFLERCVEIIILERLSKKAHPRIMKFLQSYFKKGTNYDCENIAQLLERFDVGWGKRFREFMNDNDDLVEAVASSYTLRNSIAHGGDANRGLLGVQQLYESVKTVVEGMISCT